MDSKYQQGYLERTAPFGEVLTAAGENSPMQGFDYFDSEEYKSKPNAAPGMNLGTLLKGKSLMEFRTLVKGMGRCLPGMIKGQNRNFTDVEVYLNELESDGAISPSDSPLLESYPNADAWEEVKEYAWRKHRVTIGFTDLPRDYVFEGKTVLFPYAMVCIQEMDREEINQAPELRAGIEVQKVYNSLGQATNDIARFMRKRFGLKCMANHPLGGLVNMVPLAEKAGLGRMGFNGLLVTEEYGTRHRISPILLMDQVFESTDNDAEYEWIDSFCAGCQKCRKNCPAQAINETPQTETRGTDGVRKRTPMIDSEACFPQFSKTLGCGMCIKVCPFSKPGTYEKLKNAHRKKMEKKEKAAS